MIRWFGACVLVAFSTLLAATPPALAQFSQQGGKLVGTGAVGTAAQGISVAVSADGNTAIVGGSNDNSNTGAVWVYVRTTNGWTQQGNKLVGTGAVGSANQGGAVALSADGNTAIFGGANDTGNAGAAWIFTRSGGVWTQQGNKLVGSNRIGVSPQQGSSVALSADGNIAIIGGPGDGNDGAVWIFTRSGGVWTQQGAKLTGTNGANARQGISVALSGDGNTALIGGSFDNSGVGAAWVFTQGGGVWTQQGAKLVGLNVIGNGGLGQSVALSSDGSTALVGGGFDNSGTGAAWVFGRSGGVWTQQGGKLVGSNAVGNAQQGITVGLSGDGNTALVGGYTDNANAGATWMFARSGGIWTQQGDKLVGTGAVGAALQGFVAISSDGGTAFIGGPGDNSNVGAVWVYGQPTLALRPTADIVTSGNAGGPFSPQSFDYTLAAGGVDIAYAITGVPAWLTPSSVSGTVPANTSKAINFTVNGAGNALAVGTRSAPITVTNTTSGFGSVTLNATITVGTRGPVNVVSAVLPASRSVQVGNTATAFSTIINTSDNVATNCSLGLGSSIPASFRYQTTDSATNALSGTPNTPINIPPNGVQSFVFAITPGGVFAPTDVPITAGCSNIAAAPSVVGLNTLLLSASNAPVPDIVALAATISNDGILNIPGASGASSFAVATVNVGIGSNIMVSADTGTASLPLSISMCQTNPATGQCTSLTGPTVPTAIIADGTPTFAIFVQGTANVPFSPATNRIFVRFKDGNGITRGATSVAVRTQ